MTDLKVKDPREILQKKLLEWGDVYFSEYEELFIRDCMLAYAYAFVLELFDKYNEMEIEQ